MSTKYFILTKDSNKEVYNIEKDQIHFINNNQTFILPVNNLDYYAKYGLFESGLIEWSKQYCDKSKNILDIGAHSGTYSICLAPYCKNVYSFEPQKMTYYTLCGSVALSNLDNITCFNFGLGSEDQIGERELNVVSHDGGGSTIHNTGQNILRKEKISIKTLDSLNLDNINFIKMDVEENELYVLKGAVETIKRCNYPKILFESNFTNKDLFMFIKDLGYTINPIKGINNMFIAEKK